MNSFNNHLSSHWSFYKYNSYLHEAFQFRILFTNLLCKFLGQILIQFVKFWFWYFYLNAGHHKKDKSNSNMFWLIYKWNRKNPWEKRIIVWIVNVLLYPPPLLTFFMFTYLPYPLFSTFLVQWSFGPQKQNRTIWIPSLDWRILVP